MSGIVNGPVVSYSKFLRIPDFIDRTILTYWSIFLDDWTGLDTDQTGYYLVRKSMYSALTNFNRRILNIGLGVAFVISLTAMGICSGSGDFCHSTVGK